VWVRSVESGSPADQSGLVPGDIIYQLENEVLALDGTMADYCDVLRSRDPHDTMDLTIIRWDDLSMHEGQLNGRELELTGYFEDTSSGSEGEATATEEVVLNPNCTLSDTPGYVECYDDTSTVLVEVPDYWTDFNGGQWTLEDEVIGVAISAAPSLADFNGFYDAPGMFFGASNTFAKWGGYIQFLDIYTEDYKGGCTLDGRYDYDDGLYRGKYDYYYNCGGDGGYDTYILSAVPIGNEATAIIVVIIQVPQGDTATVEQIWNTFIVGDF
jgi:serine protease Do